MDIYDNVDSSLRVDLNFAILIYSSTQKKAGGELTHAPGSIAMVHPCENGILGPGSLATTDSVRNLALSLMNNGTKAKPSLLPPNILSAGFGQMTWHCEPTKRQMWFQPAEQKRSMTKANGEILPQPHLLFAIGARGFRVFALACKGRPNEKTQLYHAPYWNVNESGGLCIGSTQFPKEVVPSAIAGFEAAFYKSRFTHATAHGTRQTRTPHIKLWLSLVGRRIFPVKELLPSKHKLGDLLTGNL